MKTAVHKDISLTISEGEARWLLKELTGDIFARRLSSDPIRETMLKMLREVLSEEVPDEASLSAFNNVCPMSFCAGELELRGTSSYKCKKCGSVFLAASQIIGGVGSVNV